MNTIDKKYRRAVSVGFELVRNFQKVKISIDQETIDYDDTAEFSEKLNELFALLRNKGLEQLDILCGGNDNGRH